MTDADKLVKAIDAVMAVGLTPDEAETGAEALSRSKELIEVIVAVALEAPPAETELRSGTICFCIGLAVERARAEAERLEALVGAK